ncbi:MULTISPECIES: acyltransferase [unclassified Pseudoalteromonas]|uniref:acyltransferase n=1 Tax=unclassified Pseudoalteromonas TaxID=194690 RepID=UPI002358FCE0|nr:MULTISPECIES: acyltransferase [unclassified Pseudoalteromonas]MDC9498771.1 acyltransferase [Pseudoalteromonas sp. Angola-20]MDC9518584.1 acyltransferase [Pseudoalteromonas sp. Angola-22]MDC9534991.1 acyltransferase [Pseudoalteromonas sp. Angola-9]
MKILKEVRYQLRYGLPVWLIMTLTAWLPDISIFIRLRGLLISLFLPGRPKGFTLGRDVTFLAIDRLFLGNGVYIAKGCWINAIGQIDFEDEVVLAPYVVMSSNNHGFKDGSVKRGGAHPGPIKIGFGTWIAAHSVVAANVVIGQGNLVAANSVVTKSTPDNSVQAGVPAKHIKIRIDNPSTINSKHDIKL